MTQKRKIRYVLILVFIIFSLFVIILEYNSYNTVKHENNQYALVLSTQVWNINKESSQVYIDLICKAENYKLMQIFLRNDDNTVEKFVATHNRDSKNLLDKILSFGLLIREHKVKSEIYYITKTRNQKEIGWIETIWINKNIYIYVIILIILALLAKIAQYYFEILSYQKRMEWELDMAADIQQHIIARQLRPWNAISFATTYLPMGKVSGDYFDIFRDPSSVYVLMADVSGHGIPAALITMAAKQAFSSAVSVESDPAEIFKTVNRTFLRRIKAPEYLTAFLIKIDENNRMQYSNASHQKAIHYLNTQDKFQQLDTNGLFIAATEEADDKYETRETKLKSGDRVYIYTDGIVEHKNDTGEEFGVERLLGLLKEHKDKPMTEVHEEVINTLKKFMGKEPIKDDISMISIEVHKNWDACLKKLKIGQEMLKRGNHKAAIQAFEEAHQLLPHYPNINLTLAQQYYNQKDYVKAETFIKDYIQNISKDLKGQQLLAQIYLKQKKYREAEKITKEINSIVPGDKNNLKLMHTILNEIKKARSKK